MSSYHKQGHRKQENGETNEPSIPVHTETELEEMAAEKKKRKEQMSGKVKR